MTLIVIHSGLVVWAPTGMFQTQCNVNVFYFPFDHQKCLILLVNVVSTGQYVNFSSYSDQMQLTVFTDSNEWKLINNTVQNVQLPLAEGFISSQVHFSFTFKRESSYYVITTILPIILLSLVGLMVFPLPPDSGEKISLTVACMMSFFITQLSISQHMPTSWTSVPIISEYPGALNMFRVYILHRSFRRIKQQSTQVHALGLV